MGEAGEIRDFLDKNFLSDDERYPLVSSDPRMAIGTNADRALGTNPDTDHLWNNFSSLTFKQLRTPGKLMFAESIRQQTANHLRHPARRRWLLPYPSLINIWATAPFFHNNMLGMFNGDPSVKGRIAAYQDAAEKLLWPEKRPGISTMKVTGTDSVLNIGHITIRVPAGTPVDLLANINVYAALQPGQVLETLDAVEQRSGIAGAAGTGL